MIVKYFATIRTYTRRERTRASTTRRRRSGRCSRRWRRATAAPFRRAVFAGDELSPEIIILVNGRNVAVLRTTGAPLAEDDEVSIFPMVAGG